MCRTKSHSFLNRSCVCVSVGALALTLGPGIGEGKGRQVHIFHTHFFLQDLAQFLKEMFVAIVPALSKHINHTTTCTE